MVIADTTRELDRKPLRVPGAPRLLLLKGFSDPILAYSVAREREVAEPLSCPRARAEAFRRSRDGSTTSRRFQTRAGSGRPRAKARQSAAPGRGRYRQVAADAGAQRPRSPRGPASTMTLSCQPQFAQHRVAAGAGAASGAPAGIQERQQPRDAQFPQAWRGARRTPGDGRALRALFAAMLKIPADGLYAPPAESPQRQRHALLRGDGGAGCSGMAQGAAASALRRGPATGSTRRRSKFVAGLLDAHRRPPDAPSGDRTAGRPGSLSTQDPPGLGARHRALVLLRSGRSSPA